MKATLWHALAALGLFAAPLAAEPVGPVSSSQAATAAGSNEAALAESAAAGGVYENGGCGAGGCGCDTSCCGPVFCSSCDWCSRTSGVFALGELTFFRYHRADGVRIGDSAPGEDVEFDFETAPRVTVGYVGDSGLGIRGRWWDYNHTAAANENDGSDLSVDTYTVDIELFDTFALGACWCLEVSGGVRFNEFEERMQDANSVDLRLNEFNGFGGVFGLELRRRLTCDTVLFARARGALLMDDKFVFNFDNGNVNNNLLFRDSTQGMIELALGVRYNYTLDSGATLFAQANAEWQNWYNYSSAFDGDEDDFVGASDVGFGGVAIGIGVAR